MTNLNRYFYGQSQSRTQSNGCVVIKADIQPVANALSSLDIYIEVDLGFMAVFLSSVGGTAPLCPLEMLQ